MKYGTGITLALFKFELKFSGSTGSVDSNFVGTSANGKSKHTDGQVWGGPFWLKRVAFDCEHSESVCESNCGGQPLRIRLWSRCMWRVLSHPECRDQTCRKDEN